MDVCSVIGIPCFGNKMLDKISQNHRFLILLYLVVQKKITQNVVFLLDDYKSMCYYMTILGDKHRNKCIPMGGQPVEIQEVPANKMGMR